MVLFGSSYITEYSVLTSLFYGVKNLIEILLETDNSAERLNALYLTIGSREGFGGC